MPCHNGGNCTNLPGNFTCVCLSGYVGDTCYSVNPCNDTEYCQNGGSCTYEVNNTKQSVNASCTCVDDWTGPHCAVVVRTQNVDCVNASSVNMSKNIIYAYLARAGYN